MKERNGLKPGQGRTYEDMDASATNILIVVVGLVVFWAVVLWRVFA